MKSKSAIAHKVVLGTCLCAISGAAFSVQPYRGGWVHDGPYASDDPVLGNKPVSDIEWAVARGMQQVTLNVGINQLIRDRFVAKTYSPNYISGSLDRKLEKIINWNRSHETQPNLQIGIKLRLHGGSRQTDAVKAQVGTVLVSDAEFVPIPKPVPMHWKQVGTRYPFREMYEAQMKQIAQAITAFNAANGDVIQSVIVPGNAFFYPEPFTIMNPSRASVKRENVTKELAVAPLLNSLKDGSGVIGTYRVINKGKNKLAHYCGTKRSELRKDQSSEDCYAPVGRNDRIVPIEGAIKFVVAGATNLEKLKANGLDEAKQKSYFGWLQSGAHSTFLTVPKVHIGIALNPYVNIDPGANDRCFAVKFGDAWVRQFKQRAQLENYSYRYKYVDRDAVPSYEAIYNAMEHWGKLKGVIVGVQLARAHRVYLPLKNDTKIWPVVASDAALPISKDGRGWSFVEPAGPKRDGGIWNAWPNAYNTGEDLEEFAKVGWLLRQNYARATGETYNIGADCR